MGLFITIEGGEGSGKSTLISKLYNHLAFVEKREVVKTFEPGATPLGKSIRELLLNQEEAVITPKAELLLFLADRAHHIETVIRPALKEGKIVLCDRFTDSSRAYQGARGGTVGLEDLCSLASNHLTPDLTFFLDVDPVIGLSRLARKKDRLEKEKIDFHQKVRQEYLRLAEKERDRFVILNAMHSPEDLFQAALGKVKHELFRASAL